MNRIIVKRGGKRGSVIIRKIRETIHAASVKSVMVNAKHENYRDVKAVLIERYGRPTSTKKETLQNGYGAKFSSEVLHWQGRRVSLTLHERTSTVDKTAFIFRDNFKAEAASESAGQKRKADASKL